MNKISYMLAMVIVPLFSYSQSKWDGGGSDGLWKTPQNWISDISPIAMPSEDILLDNSAYPDSYTVRISAMDSVIIHSLTISPATGRTITVIIDTANKVSIALTVTSNEQGIVIYNGGVLINASGAADGAVIDITDSMKIGNGGIYSHRTRRAHAALVSRLSRIAGTETGIFEFNIPSASNTLSLSNQVYGTLRLSGEVYGKNTTYSGGATNPLHIRGNLELDTGVSLSLNFGDTVLIDGNYRQKGGVFNVANSTRASTIIFRGDLLQSGGTISRSGTALPTLIMNGPAMQHLNMTGGIKGNINLKIDNPAGITLSSALVVPSLLELLRGKIVSSPECPLILDTGSRVKADSSSDISFVDGPLRKQGLLPEAEFLFPVGKNSIHRWLRMKQASGSFNVEYFGQDPHDISDALAPGVDHISRVEYWSVRPDSSDLVSGKGSAKVILSYDENSSGGVTDLSTLRVAGYNSNNMWSNYGNEAVTGSAGTMGSVESSFIPALLLAARFTLASSSPVQNPLPLRLISFTIAAEKDHTALAWQMENDELVDHFEIECSSDGHLFNKRATLKAGDASGMYVYNDYMDIAGIQFYRLKVTGRSGVVFYSKTLKTGNDPFEFECKRVGIKGNSLLECLMQSDKKRSCRFELFDMTSRRLMFIQKDLQPGDNLLQLASIWLPAGVYVLKISDGGSNRIIKKFLR